MSALRGHESLPLSAGWQVQYTADGLTAPERADLLRSLAWRNDRLVFHLTPLTAVIEELNRYYPGRIVLVNPQLGRHLVNGVVDVSNPQAALQAI